MTNLPDGMEVYLDRAIRIQIGDKAYLDCEIEGGMLKVRGFQMNGSSELRILPKVGNVIHIGFEQ